MKHNKISIDSLSYPEIISYEEYLSTKRFELIIKFILDRILAVLLLIVLSPIIIILSVLIKLDSKGPVFFRQERVTHGGKIFRIFKFRTMEVNAESKGSLVTLGKDSRITRVGRYIRKYRLDEIPQLFNVILGDMSFVGTRPEVQKYVNKYTNEMMATLLLPAGITSPASIAFKNEDELMLQYTEKGFSPDEAYVLKVLPEKMKFNLDYIRKFNLFTDLKIMFQTVIEIIK